MVDVVMRGKGKGERGGVGRYVGYILRMDDPGSRTDMFGVVLWYYLD